MISSPRGARARRWDHQASQCAGDKSEDECADHAASFAQTDLCDTTGDKSVHSLGACDPLPNTPAPSPDRAPNVRPERPGRGGQPEHISAHLEHERDLERMAPRGPAVNHIASSPRDDEKRTASQRRSRARSPSAIGEAAKRRPGCHLLGREGRTRVLREGPRPCPLVHLPRLDRPAPRLGRGPQHRPVGTVTPGVQPVTENRSRGPWLTPISRPRLRSPPAP